jgi:hypothetical protein
MSLPIKDTPVLTGKDASRFINRMIRVETKPPSKKARAEYERAKKVYDDVMKKERQVYFVTCIRTGKLRKDGQLDFSEHKDRCWGYYFNLNLAVEHVKKNVTDICEDGYYNYCIIEKIPEGILPLEIEEMQWFKWNGKQYKECKKPKWSQGIVSWSIC